jgi:hypothetical protein
MTTPTKQYQNVSYAELLSYSENNPNRTRTLESIEVQIIKPAQETLLDNLGLTGYTAVNLNPTGILSLLICIQDPAYYSLAAKNARTQKIIDLATNLQQKTDELKNTHLSRKRKKLHDLIGTAYNGGNLDEKDYTDLFSGLSYLTENQFILMKSATQETIESGETEYETSLKGEILFSSDPVTWKRDIPVWIADFRARWVAIPTENTAQSIHKIIGNWLSTIENTGWIIQWPEIDATKAELIEKLSVLSTWKETDSKLSKSILSSRLGRANAIKLFSNWTLDNTDI